MQVAQARGLHAFAAISTRSEAKMENPMPIPAPIAPQNANIPPQDLGEIPPGVIPAPQRANPDASEAGPLQGSESDNRSVAAGEGSGNCGDMLGSGQIELAGEA
jgi:hypothetical protein